jgi:ribosomal protein L30/L7E
MRKWPEDKVAELRSLGFNRINHAICIHGKKEVGEKLPPTFLCRWVPAL